MRPSVRAMRARFLVMRTCMGCFTDLALRLVNDHGVIAYLTPTSFLGGQYFKSLRKLILEQASPVAFDFVADRNGVFDDVLQETILVSYRMGRHALPAQVSLIVPQGLEAARVESPWDLHAFRIRARHG